VEVGSEGSRAIDIGGCRCCSIVERVEGDYTHKQKHEHQTTTLHDITRFIGIGSREGGHKTQLRAVDCSMFDIKLGL
jgi:hypothetical protein